MNEHPFLFEISLRECLSQACLVEKSCFVRWHQKQVSVSHLFDGGVFVGSVVPISDIEGGKVREHVRNDRLGRNPDRLSMHNRDKNTGLFESSLHSSRACLDN
jgi:hypothetical protein